VQRLIVFGASGYTGLELLRWLSLHPQARVVAASSDRWAGDPAFAHSATAPRGLIFVGHKEALARVEEGDIVLLATSAEVSLDLVPELLQKRSRVIDLSGAFRLASAEDFARWYGFAHKAPELLTEAAYGLPEISPPPPNARLVANPGCYATAAAIAVTPLVRRGLVEDGAPIVIDGKSGTTGAGRKSDEALSYSEVADTVRPYRLLSHQHTPEIERTVASAANKAVCVLFTPQLVPMRRGLLVTAYAPARQEVDAEAVARAFAEEYADARFVVIPKDRAPETGTVIHTNFCEVAARFDPRTRVITAIAALDNLVKGAAGQAIQNMNRMMGIDEATGLLAGGGGA
jgi:N-acetyl-gamma-glutamyl-phosphate reductase